MSLKKILVKGSTRLSLHERFTYLRSHTDDEPSTTQSVHMQSVRQGLFSQQQASSKNRRLAQMMDRRPTVIAALRLKNKIVRNRLGVRPRQGSVKDRLTLRGGRGGALRGRLGQRSQSFGRSPLTRPQFRQQNFRGNRRGGRGNLSRSQSLSNLSRSQSMQSLSGRRSSMSRGGGGRFQNRSALNHQDLRRGGRGRGFRQGGGDGFYRNRQDRRGGANNRFNNRGQRSRGFRSRGGGRGRGRGGQGQVPTREELDSQLDQYMATSRSELDKELNIYMSKQESWD